MAEWRRLTLLCGCSNLINIPDQLRICLEVTIART